MRFQSKFLHAVIRASMLLFTLEARAGTLDRMTETARALLGPAANIEIKVYRRNDPEQGQPRSFWAALGVLNARGETVGTIELQGVPYTARYDALEDVELVTTTLDLLPDHRNYPEMVRILARPQATLRAQSLPSPCGATLEAAEAGPESFNPMIKIGGERAISARFQFNADQSLELVDIRANANLELKGTPVRRRGFGTRLIADALALFPETRAVKIPAMVDDNGVLSRVTNARKFPGTLYLVPSYRTLNRMGFGQVRTIFVRNYFFPGRMPTYGLELERW